VVGCGLTGGIVLQIQEVTIDELLNPGSSAVEVTRMKLFAVDVGRANRVDCEMRLAMLHKLPDRLLSLSFARRVHNGALESLWHHFGPG